MNFGPGVGGKNSQGLGVIRGCKGVNPVWKGVFPVWKGVFPVCRMRVHLLNTPPQDSRVDVYRLSTPPQDSRVTVRQRAIR